jgi:cytochrome c peroxidase
MTKMKAVSVAVALVVAGSAWAAVTVRDEPIKPIEPARVADPAKVELGKKLWFEPRLSMSGIISCNYLPQPVDGRHRQPQDLDRPRLAGRPGQLADGATTPVFAIAQFWDGRAPRTSRSRPAARSRPIVEVNMAFTHELGDRTSCSPFPGYVAEFKSVYRQGCKIDIDRITDSPSPPSRRRSSPRTRASTSG